MLIIKKNGLKKKENNLNLVFSCLRYIKKDLLKPDNKYESGEIFHDWINLHKPYILRKKKFTKNSVDYVFLLILLII